MGADFLGVPTVEHGIAFGGGGFGSDFFLLMVQRLNQVLELSDNGRVREHQIDTLSVIADDTEQEIPAIIKCGDVFGLASATASSGSSGRVSSWLRCQSRVLVSFQKAVNRSISSTGPRISLLRAASAGGGQVEKGKTGGCREFEHDYLHNELISWK